MTASQSELCPDATLADAVARLQADERAGAERVQALSLDFPADARLHFLHGSLRAAAGAYDEALQSMRRAVALDPRFAVARFQLGLLELSSGEAAAARATLEPLDEGGGEDALSLFARGLRRLASDDLASAADLLRRGIAAGGGEPLIRRDMQMMLERIEAESPPPTQQPQPEPEQEISAAHLLLRQYAAKPTRH
jgi:predicted Zn-dependent protease